MKSVIRTSFLIFMLAFTLGLLAEAHKWPVIQPLELKHVFKDLVKNNTADTPLIAFIKDKEGLPVYKLECHNGNYENDSEMNFSGDFQCALFAIKGTTLTSSDLLADGTGKNELSTDWWNRGRMRSAQLRGKCLNYPEYSTDRHFKLRGMLVTLQFKNIQWSNRGPLLTGFAFTFKVVPEESALSSRAEQVSDPEPPTSCYP